MKRLRLAMCAWAMLATGAGTTENTTVMLPLALLNKAHQAGSDIEVVEIVDGARVGLFDRDGGAHLRIGRAAHDLAATPDEKDALLAIALSHRIGTPTPTRPDATRAGNALQDALAGGFNDALPSRDRTDAYLGLPTAPRRRQALADRGDPTILRGVAVARAAGVCEKVSVGLLDRLATSTPKSGPVASDARAALKALGLLRFTPDERC